MRRFSVLRSFDGETWFELFRKNDDSEFEVFTAAIAKPRPARFVRLQLDGGNYLHICACEVFGARADPEAARESHALDAAALRRRRAIPEGKTGHIAVIGGFNVFVDDAYSDLMRRNLDSGNYEGRERSIVARRLRPMDRVLEAGTAVGVVSMTAAAMVGEGRVVTFEANPAMVEAARDNFQRNGLNDIAANLAVLANRTQLSEAKTVPFYLSRDFWASRLDAKPGETDIVAKVDVPIRCLEDELRQHNANVIVCDIEGGEVALFNGADLSGVRLIIMETHYNIAGEAATDAMIKNLIMQGFAIHLRETMPELVVLRR